MRTRTGGILNGFQLRLCTALLVGLALSGCGGGGTEDPNSAEALARRNSGHTKTPTTTTTSTTTTPTTSTTTTTTSTTSTPTPTPTPTVTPTVTTTASLMPAVNVSLIPLGDAGSAVDKVLNTGEMPVPTDGTAGEFRTVCQYSHMAFDDPIVFPGQPGVSHLHTFFGNTGTNANSTATSLATTGNSTCRGGTVNRSAYWVPTMIDTRTGAPVKPKDAGFYYKTPSPSTVQVLPAGLRMIAGDPKNTQIPTAGGLYEFKCIGSAAANALVGLSIQNCPSGSELWQVVIFPQCWDGANLDSPDHKSHMAYPNNGMCPVTHPVRVPVITLNVVYTITEDNAPSYWRLSSDNYSSSLPGGYSSHGDWFNGWKADIMDTFVTKCLKAAQDCHSHLLGDGRAID
jgi:hypothetical protein